MSPGVGRLGKEAVAGVAIAGNLTFIVLAITQMLGVGVTTLVSHAAGRKDRERALLVFNESLLLSALVGGIFLAAGMLLRMPYVRALGADERTAQLAADYLAWFIPAMALQFAMVSMGAALRGTGNFKPGMAVQTTTVVLNMVLAPVLIFGWGTGRPLGVAGAAISSLVAIGIGAAWLSFYFVGDGAYLRFVRRGWRPDGALWRQILGIGLPAGAEFALISVYLFIVYGVSRPFGSAAQAGFGIGERIKDVQRIFRPVFDARDLKPEGGDFDRLFRDGERFPLGALEVEVLHVPGHTPADIAYKIGDDVFVGDTLFMHDYGTARADFPGGDARALFRSIKRLLALPPDTRLWMCHDYKAPGRDRYAWRSTVAEQRASNPHVKDGTTEEEFVRFRTERDKGLAAPALLLPSIQVNIRAGRFPEAEENGVRYLKIPVKAKSGAAASLA